MKLHRPNLWQLLAAVAVIAALLLLSGCGSLGGDQNTFAPKGEVAEKQRDLFYLVLVPATIICVLVGGALVYILVRYRRRRDDEPMPYQLHGNTRLELAWTIAPAVLLLGLAVPTVLGIVDLSRAADDDALPVRVVAFQWDWRFEYLDMTTLDAEGEPVVLFESDELHVPVDRQVAVQLHALDVIHSFWVPKLAGKLDVVPGRNNEMWFSANEPGVYAAQCAEFCGIGHSIMRFEVVAETPADFDAWYQDQLAAASGEPAAGQ